MTPIDFQVLAKVKTMAGVLAVVELFYNKGVSC